MLPKLVGTWRVLASFSQKRPAQIAIVVSSFALMLYTFVSSYSRLGGLSSLQFNWTPVLIGFLFTGFSFWLGTCAWVFIVRAFQPQISSRQAVRYHMFSMATKYLPGPGWQQLSKAFQLYQHGFSSREVWTLVALEFVMMLLTGLATMTQILAVGERQFAGYTIPPVAGVAVSTLLGSICVGLPVIAWKLQNDGAKIVRIQKTFLLWLWGAEILDVLGWLASGVSLWLIARGLMPVSTGALSYCIVTLIISFMIGFAVIVAPNGWGIRELTMATLLQFLLPVPANVIVSLASRVVLVAVEFLGVVTFAAIGASKRLFGRRLMLPRDSD